MATLVELDVEWVEAPASTPSCSVFLRCQHRAEAAGAGTFLQLELLHGASLWRADVHERQKPSVLACSATEYLAVLERAFTGVGTTTTTTHGSTRFTYKWSTSKATLTLMEHAGGPEGSTTATAFAMKYTAILFAAVDTQETANGWQQLLHDVVVESRRAQSTIASQRMRIQDLEAVVIAKDQLLETALKAKQNQEDDFFGKFCAVLNAKKAEIERLRLELALARAKSSATAPSQAAAAKKKKIAPRKRKQNVGAKLSQTKRPRVGDRIQIVGDDEIDEPEDQSHDEAEANSDNDDEDSSDGHSRSEGEDEDASSSEEEGDANKSTPQKSRKRKTREAIGAYSQLPSEWKTSSQVCSANDVLEDLDAIMKTEVDEDERTQNAGKSNNIKKMPPTSTELRSRLHSDKKMKLEQPAAKTERAQLNLGAKVKTAKPPSPVKAMDSEEEDILDMLA